MSECSHKETISTWVKDEDWDGNDTSHWETKTVSTFRDLDLHRYKCTQCNKVFYYSTKAREHFTGVKVDPDIQESNERYLARGSK